MKRKLHKFVKLLLALCLLFVFGAGLRCSREVDISHTCQVGGRCTVTTTIKITFLTGDSLYGEKDDVANGAYILDLANPWEPDSSFTPQATIGVMTDSGLVSQTFDLSYDSTASQTIPLVDSDTSPRAFVFSNPSAVESFLGTAAAASSSPQPDSDVDFTIALIQTDCDADSGKYVNHARYKNGTNITYVESVYFQYTQSPSAPLACNQGEIEILE